MASNILETDMLPNILQELLAETSEDFKKLENSDEYRALISRKKQLISRKNTLVDEIFEYRNFSDKIDNLNKAKSAIDEAIKETESRINSMESNVTADTKLRLTLKAMKSDPFEEFFNPKPKPKPATNADNKTK